MPFPFPCSPVIRKCSWMKTQIEEKNLDDIVNKYKNTYHSTIKTEPADVKPSTYFDFS